MKEYMEKRALALAEYIIKNKVTVREAAKKFGVSKSTVHKDIAERLMEISPKIAEKANRVLQENKEERHIRGGLATKKKYEKQ